MSGRTKGFCSCGNVQESKGIIKGQRVYGIYCTSCRKNKYRRNIKREKCIMCGFIPVHPSQIDIDHIDGNHSNNDPSNLQTICANCHRLKTYVNRDWESRSSKVEVTN
jgi:hypothetical protein